LPTQRTEEWIAVKEKVLFKRIVSSKAERNAGLGKKKTHLLENAYGEWEYHAWKM